MVMNITLPGLGKEKNVKDCIISILSNKWPLSGKKIYNIIRKQYELSVTYQAVHKALKQLAEDDVLLKTGREYKLNDEWIEHIREFGGKTKDVYSIAKKDIEKFSIFNFTFTNQIEMGNFIIDLLEKDQEEPIFVNWSFMWCPLFLSKKNYIKLKELLSKRKTYIVCKTKRTWDEWLLGLWKEIGAEVRLDINCASECDMIISKDNVIQVFWSEHFRNQFDDFMKGVTDIKEMNMNDLFYRISEIETKVYIVINKNKEVADEMRNKTLKCFDENYTETVERGPQSFTFNTLFELDRFIMEIIEQNLLDPKDRKISCSYWRHMWWPLFYTKESYMILKKITNKERIYFICSGNTPIEKWCAEFYKKLGMNVIINKNLEEGFDFLVIGDRILQIYYPQALKRKMDRIFSETKDISEIDMEELVSNIFEMKTKIQIIIIKNKELADELGGKVSNSFKK